MPIPGTVILGLVEGFLSFLLVFLMFYTFRQGAIGREATVLKAPNNPYALIQAQGAKWYAVTKDGASLAPGDTVVVSGFQGIQLAVVTRKTADSTEETPSSRNASNAWRLFLGAFALLYFLKALKAWSEGEQLWMAVTLTLAIFLSLFVSGALRHLQLTWPKLLALLLLVALVAFGIVWIVFGR